VQKHSSGGGKRYEKSYLLVDGYNIIFAWDSLKKTAQDSLESARKALLERLSVYKVFSGYEIILVFDAYKVKGNRGEVEKEQGITVVYTKEAQTADAYIEKAVRELTKQYNVTVATSDGLEQLIIFGSGAYRLPASHLEAEVKQVEAGVAKMVEQYNLETNRQGFLRVLEDKLAEWKEKNGQA